MSPVGLSSREGRQVHVEHCMGTVFSVDVREPFVAPSVLADAVAWLHEVDRRFSPFRDDSEISRLARGELRVEDCHVDVREVLDTCEALRATTDGYFDVAYSGGLDPCGYVKGWAIEHVASMLVAGGATNHSVNGGGDVQCSGRPSPDRPWSVGVADPGRPDRMIAVVTGSDVAVATSGTAERGEHVRDPHTGSVPAGLRSVTVIGTWIALTDAWATAAYARGPGAAAWLAERPGAGGVVVDGTGAIEYVTGRGGQPPTFEVQLVDAGGAR